MTGSHAGRKSRWARDAVFAAADGHDAPRPPLLQRLAKASQGRATVADLLAQAAGLAALAVATLGLWVLKIWG